MSATEEEVVLQESTETEESKGVKRPVEEVHSVNNWEGANLGDDERKQKFLRLMGASKKEHHGKIVIGDQADKTKHADASEKADEINHALEDQYLQGLEMKLTGASRRHVGLGFHEEEGSDDAAKGDSAEEKKESEADSGAPSEENSCDSKEDDKNDSNDKDEEEKDSKPPSESEKDGEDSAEKNSKSEKEEGEKKPAYMMGFVKSSS